MLYDVSHKDKKTMPYVYEYKVCPNCGYTERKKRYGCLKCVKIHSINTKNSQEVNQKRESSIKKFYREQPHMKRSYWLEQYNKNKDRIFTYNYQATVDIPRLPDEIEPFNFFVSDDDYF